MPGPHSCALCWVPPSLLACWAPPRFQHHQQHTPIHTFSLTCTHPHTHNTHTEGKPIIKTQTLRWSQRSWGAHSKLAVAPGVGASGEWVTPRLRGAQECLGLGPLRAPASPWGLACLRVGLGGPCLLVLPKCPEKTPLKHKHERSKGQGLRCLEGSGKRPQLQMLEPWDTQQMASACYSLVRSNEPPRVRNCLSTGETEAQEGLAHGPE